MSRVLPKAPGYTFIDTNLGQRFYRDRIYDLNKITDQEIDRLLSEDPTYWEGKFEKVPAQPKRKRKAGSKKEEEEEEEE